MNEPPETWMVVVAPGPPDLADRAFAAWKDAHGRPALADEDVLIDLVRGADGTQLRRDRVREPAKP